MDLVGARTTAAVAEDSGGGVKGERRSGRRRWVGTEDMR